MSQNFELLSQLEADFAFSAASHKVMPKAEKAAGEYHPAFVHQELLNLVQTVFLSGNENAPQTVVICGVDERSGSSQICLQLGRILARRSTRPVCIVDANIGSSRLAHLLNIDPHPAVSIALDVEVEQVEKDLWLTSIDALGCTSGDSLGPTDQLKQRLEKLRKTFEYILIDAPGANGRGDAGALSQIANGAILVIEASSTRKAAAMKAKIAMESMNVRLFGCVLNNRIFPIPEKLYRKL